MTFANLDNTTLTVLSIVGVLVVLALVAWAMQRRNQSDRLRQRFGSEYSRMVGELGSRDKAEAELLARQRRVEKLHIVALSPADADRYAREWQLLQGRFVDDPHATLAEADRLVRELMLQRGYPMGDFERRAADISVDHPHVVDHYRAAQAVALRDRNGQADTEDLRKAVVHYRALFDELLEVAPTRANPYPHTTRHMEARS
ncbi:MAG TPA: hypothetical protein VFK10_00010 [Burkholderiaceae bacterium]|nr:hypothetical protein [Burkholderiaceae bacterium]